MTLLDEKIAALFRKGLPTFGGADPAVVQPIGDETSSEAVVSAPAVEEINGRPVGGNPSLMAEEATTAQTRSPLAGLDRDTTIRLRWALRDIKAKRTKLMPV